MKGQVLLSAKRGIECNDGRASRKGRKGDPLALTVDRAASWRVYKTNCCSQRPFSQARRAGSWRFS